MGTRFKFNGANNTALPATVSPDSGSGYFLVTDGAAQKYSTSQAYEGTSSLVGDGSGYVWVDEGDGWPYVGDQTATYLDFFFYLPSAPASDTFIVGGVYLATAGLYITTDRRLAFKDSGGTVRGQTSANAVPAATWVRIRVRYGTANGVDYAWLWTANFTTDDPSTAGATTLAATAGMAMGFIAINPTTQFYLDDIVIAPISEGDPSRVTGPATVAATASLSNAATLSATGSRAPFGSAALSNTATLSATGDVLKVVTAVGWPDWGFPNSLINSSTLTLSQPWAITGSATLQSTALLTVGATIRAASLNSLISGLAFPNDAYMSVAIEVPGYDFAYSITLSNAVIGGYGIPYVCLRLPTPTDPDVYHWVSVTGTILDRSRYLGPDWANRNQLNEGVVYQVDPTPGSTGTLRWYWDVSRQMWRDDTPTGAIYTEDHRPNEAPYGIPLYFSPECRARPDFEQIKAQELRAHAAIPLMTNLFLAGTGVVIDISTGDSNHQMEWMSSRFKDMSSLGSAFGNYGWPFVSARQWPGSAGVCDGRVMLHELGHVWDAYALQFGGWRYGYENTYGWPKETNGTRTFYHDPPNETVVKWHYVLHGDLQDVWVYDTSGNLEYYWPDGPRGVINPPLQGEQPILDMFAVVAADPDYDGRYYVDGGVTEWVAQMMANFWCEAVPGYVATPYYTSIADPAQRVAFYDYMIEIGALGMMDALRNTATLSVSSSLQVTATAGLSNTSSLTVTATRAVPESAALSSSATLTVTAETSVGLSVSLTSGATLSVGATATHVANAALVSVATLSVSGYATRPASLSLVSVSTLYAGATSTGSTIHVWVNGSWTPTLVRRWDDALSTWVPQQLLRWEGSAWVPA